MRTRVDRQSLKFLFIDDDELEAAARADKVTHTELVLTSIAEVLCSNHHLATNRPRTIPNLHVRSTPSCRTASLAAMAALNDDLRFVRMGEGMGLGILFFWGVRFHRNSLPRGA